MRTFWKARGMWVKEGWALHVCQAESAYRVRLHGPCLPSRWAGPGAPQSPVYVAGGGVCVSPGRGERWVGLRMGKRLQGGEEGAEPERPLTPAAPPSGTSSASLTGTSPHLARCAHLGNGPSDLARSRGTSASTRRPCPEFPPVTACLCLQPGC